MIIRDETLSFTRLGSDAEAVISDTVKQVLAALPEGAKLREIKPNLVSLADVAAKDVSSEG